MFKPAHSCLRPCGPPLRLPRERGATWWLCGSRSRLDGRDGPGNCLVHRQEDLLAVMAYLQRRALEQAVRRFRRCDLDTQAASAEQEVEGKASQRTGQPWREGE